MSNEDRNQANENPGEQPATSVTPEGQVPAGQDMPAIIMQVTKAIESLGNLVLATKKESRKLIAVAVLFALFVVFVVFMLIFFDKVSSEAAAFLLGSMVTGTFAVLGDLLRRDR